MDQRLDRPKSSIRLEQSEAWLDLQAPFDLLSRVASMYYLEDKAQVEIAKELGLSRQKVQRLLKQAKDQRIVEIHVHAVPVLHSELESKLKRHFNFKRCGYCSVSPR